MGGRTSRQTGICVKINLFIKPIFIKHVLANCEPWEQDYRLLGTVTTIGTITKGDTDMCIHIWYAKAINSCATTFHLTESYLYIYVYIRYNLLKSLSIQRISLMVAENSSSSSSVVSKETHLDWCYSGRRGWLVLNRLVSWRKKNSINLQRFESSLWQIGTLLERFRIVWKVDAFSCA